MIGESDDEAREADGQVSNWLWVLENHLKDRSRPLVYPCNPSAGN